MRAGLAILSILIVVAIIFYVSFGLGGHGYEGAVMKQGDTARKEAEQLNGQNEQGVSIQDAGTYEDDMVNGEFRGLKILTLASNGPLVTAYGAAVGDEIVEADQLALRGYDPGLARTEVYTGYAKNQAIVVRRDGQEVTLTPKKSALSISQPKAFNSVPVPSH